MYIFCGESRQSDVAEFLHALGAVEVLVQFDLLRSQDHDLTSEELWDKIFGMLSEGGWILLASPPCETFTRVRHQRPGPPPLRSSAFPFGFPWLRNSDADKVRTANYFISQTLSACGIAAQAGGAYFIEHPEDLGVTSSKEVPASIWQWPEVRDLQVQTHAITFAIFQCIYEAPTSKPTRFLTTLRAFLDAPPAFATWPRFDSQGRYVGPLPPRCPHGKHQKALVGRSGHEWATKGSAAYPPLMCEWIAHAVLDSAPKGIRVALHPKPAQVQEEARVAQAQVQVQVPSQVQAAQAQVQAHLPSQVQVPPQVQAKPAQVQEEARVAQAQVQVQVPSQVQAAQAQVQVHLPSQVPMPPQVQAARAQVQVQVPSQAQPPQVQAARAQVQVQVPSQVKRVAAQAQSQVPSQVTQVQVPPEVTQGPHDAQVGARAQVQAPSQGSRAQLQTRLRYSKHYGVQGQQSARPGMHPISGKLAPGSDADGGQGSEVLG